MVGKKEENVVGVGKVVNHDGEEGGEYGWGREGK